MTKRLLPKHQAFITHYLSGMGAGKAAVAAGYAEGNSRNRAAKLLKHPGVAAEIAKAQERLREEANYTADKAMIELDNAIEFAKQTENATAYVRAIEMKAKLCGLLEEKLRITASSYQFVFADVAAPQMKVINHND